MTEFNLSEAVEETAQRSGADPVIVKDVIGHFAQITAHHLGFRTDQRVEYKGFGVFKLVHHIETRRELNGKEYIIPAHYTVEFIPANSFLATVNFQLKGGLNASK